MSPEEVSTEPGGHGALTRILRELCDGVPEAIGAILCDGDGEAIAWARGGAAVPEEATSAAVLRVPEAFRGRVSAEEFLLRLAGAEPCALIHMLEEHGRSFGAGPLACFELRFERASLLVSRLPEDCYLMLAVTTPCVTALARRRLKSASRAVEGHLG